MADEYISKKKAIDELDYAYKHGAIIDRYGLSTAQDVIDEIESADVAPVVRCRDCKHYYFTDNRIPQEQRYVCEISGEIWKPDDFCSYGERKEEEA